MPYTVLCGIAGVTNPWAAAPYRAVAGLEMSPPSGWLAYTCVQLKLCKWQVGSTRSSSHTSGGPVHVRTHQPTTSTGQFLSPSPPQAAKP